MAGPGIEDHDTHRRGVDQGLQVGPDPLLGPVRAGVGDRRRRLRREQHQDLFVRRRELLSAFLSGEKEVADSHAPMPHRRSLEGLRPHQVRGKAQRPDVAGQVAAGVSAPGRSRRCSKSRGPSGQSASCWCSSGVKPELTKS